MRLFTIMARVLVTVGAISTLIAFCILYNNIDNEVIFSKALIATNIAATVFKLGVIINIIRLAIHLHIQSKKK